MQNFKIKMSRYIVQDFKCISVYLSQTRKNELMKEIRKKLLNLKQMPKMYQRIYYEEKTKIDYRRIVCMNYIITYKIHKNEITILRIVSQRENYLKSNYLKSL